MHDVLARSGYVTFGTLTPPRVAKRFSREMFAENRISGHGSPSPRSHGIASRPRRESVLEPSGWHDLVAAVFGVGC
jgi:hypothetical protein